MISKIDMNTMDKNVGRRIEKGFTQQQLAKALSLSYQQLQKNETGTNRVSVGRLYFIARLLQTPISYFYKDLPLQLGNQLNDREKAG